MSVKLTQVGDNNNKYHLGEKTIQKKWLLKKEERLVRSGKIESLQEKTIFSIRIESLKPGSEQVKPDLNLFKKRYWVPLNIGTKENPHFVLANIMSVANHTGLTPDEIKEAAYENQVVSSKKSSSKKNKDVQRDLQKSLLAENSQSKDVSKPDLENIFESNVNLKEGVMAEVDSRSHLGYREPIEEKDYISIVKRIKIFQKKHSQFPLESQDNSPVKLHAQVIQWDEKSNLHVYVSSKGETFLSFLAKKVGDGSFKNVYTGYYTLKPEQIVIGMPYGEKDMYKEEEREYLLLKKAQGPGVCECHAYIELAGDEVEPHKLAMVLKKYNGGDLEKSLKKIDGLPKADCIASQVQIVNDLAVGLARLHGQVGIIHRDIKPGNILLTKDHQGKVTEAVFTDFGLSKDKEEGTLHEGTWGYFSPRQMEEGGGLYTDDIWALGLTFYKMINLDTTIPFFTESDELIKLTIKCQDKFHPPTEDDLSALKAMKLKLAKEATNNFEIIRPTELTKNEEADPLQLIQNQMEILSWDMLFSKPTMNAAQILERSTKLKEDLAAITRSNPVQ